MVTKKEQIIQELSEKNIIDCQTLAGWNLWGDVTRDRERLEVKNAILKILNDIMKAELLKKMFVYLFFT